MIKRLLSCAAALCLAASLIPATALAIPAESFFAKDTRVLTTAEAGDGGPVSIALTAPETLVASEDGGYADNPFQVRAKVTASAEASNVMASISTDPSVVVIDEALAETIPLGTFAAGTEKGAAWTLRAIPQATVTTVDLKVTVRGSGFDDIVVTERITLGAVSDGQRERTVSFVLDGGSLEGTSLSVKVPVGARIAQPDDPVKQGSRFDGWYANPQCEGLPWFNALNSYQGEPVTGDMTLYAKWKGKEFDRALDGLSFINYAADFFNSGDVKNYSVADDYKDLLLQQMTLSYGSRLIAQETLESRMNETWMGSCFGMAALTCLICAGEIAPDFLQASATTASDLAAPKASSAVKNAVTYYFLEQLYGTVGTQRANYDHNDEKANNERLVSSLSEEGAYPVVIGIDLFGWNGARAGGHAVVAYDIAKVGENYEVGIWDPSYPDGKVVSKLTVAGDFSNSWFDGVYDGKITGSGADYGHSFLKYCLRVEDGYDKSINIQKLLSQKRSASGLSIASRTVQLAEEGEEPPAPDYDHSNLKRVEIETNCLTLLIRGTFDLSPHSQFEVDEDGYYSLNINNGTIAATSGYRPDIEILTDEQGSLRMRVKLLVFSDDLAIQTFDAPQDGQSFQMTCRTVDSTVSARDPQYGRFASFTAPDRAIVHLTGWKGESAPGGCMLGASGNLSDPAATSLTFSYDRHQIYVYPFVQEAGRTVTLSGAPVLGVSKAAFGAQADYQIAAETQDASVPLIVSASDGHNSPSAELGWASIEHDASEEGWHSAALRLTERASSPNRIFVQSDTGTVDESDWADIASFSFNKSISFHTAGGSTVEGIEDVGLGATLHDVETPQREGFVFDGWFTNPSCSPEDAWDPAIDAVMDHMTLFAKWRRDAGFSHRVTFKKTVGGCDVVFLVNDDDSLSLTEENLPESPTGLWDWSDFSHIKRDIVVNARKDNESEKSAPSTYSVTLNNAEHGTLAAEGSSPLSGLYEGNTARIELTPSAGFKVGDIDITDENGDSVAVSAQGGGVYVFAMPASDVSVTATFVDASTGVVTYAVDTTPVQGGSFSATVAGVSASRAECGDIVTIAVTAFANYGFDVSTFSVKDSAGNDVVTDRLNAEGTLYSFVMPASPIMVVGAFKATDPTVPTYVVTLPTITHASIESTCTRAMAGETVIVTVTPDEGYEVDRDSISVVAATGANVNSAVTGSGACRIEFPMPASDVTVGVSIVGKTYDVIWDEMEHGTVTASSNEAKTGETVMLTAVAHPDYELAPGGLSVTTPGGVPVDCTENENGTYSFTMPASNVIVSATFVPKRDTTKPYLQFIDRSAGTTQVDVRAKRLGLIEEAVLEIGEKLPSEEYEPETDWSWNDMEAQTSDESILDAVLLVDASGNNTGELGIVPKKAGTATVTVSVAGVYDGGQAAQCRVTVTPYETKVLPAESVWEKRATVVIADDPIVAKALDTGIIKLKVSTMATGELTAFVANKKSSDEELVRLVDLSFVNDEDAPVESIEANGTTIDLQTIPRTVTFVLDDAMQAHLRAAHGLFVAYANPATDEWTPLASAVDQNESMKLSFTANHFSTYAIMASDIPSQNPPQNTPQEKPPTTLFPIVPTPDPDTDNGDDRNELEWSAGRPIYVNDTDTIVRPNANQSASTANGTVYRGATSTAGASTAGGSTSLVKTGDALAGCTVAVGGIFLVTFLFLRRAARR